MIDIHCHILHGVDDGASSLEEALEMARMAAFSGVTEIAATPHFRGEREFLEERALQESRYLELKEALERWKIPIRLHQGAEVLCLPQTVELAEMGELPTLGDTNYVLTEFYFDESFDFMDEILEQIALNGYRPVVAHPERYASVQREPRKLHRWAREGYVLQLNKGSILGALGSRAEAAAHELLALGLAHLIASDAHSSYTRTPHMSEVQRWAEDACDPECAEILLRENPKRLLQGRGMFGES